MVEGARAQKAVSVAIEKGAPLQIFKMEGEKVYFRGRLSRGSGMM